LSHKKIKGKGRKAMIVNFEEYTHSLTYEENKIFLPFICDLLQKCIGKELAITNKKIRQLVKDENLKISDSRVRKIINIIRNKDIIPCLISSQKGYYISESKNEIEIYIKSLLQRCSAIWQVAESLERQKKNNIDETK
jgi:hypothetical protein